MDTITTTATSTTDPTRRVRLTLGLRDRPHGQPFLAHSPEYTCAVEPLDDLARTYKPANWESGILSGAGFAARHWLGDRQGLLLTELRGHVGGDGIEAVAVAAAAALAVLLGKEEPQPSPVWSVHVESPTNGQDNRTVHAAAGRLGA